MRSLPVFLGVCVVIASTAGCSPECQSLLDCPIGEICNAEGTCIVDTRVPVERCPAGEYDVTITITAPDGDTKVPGTIQVDGAAAVDTGNDASITVTLPSGFHNIKAQHGDFFADFEIEVCGNDDVKAKVRPAGTLGVIPGAFDSLEEVLDKMGFNEGSDFELIGATELSSAATMAQYRYLFFNCGHDVGITPEIGANLDAWVNDGGAVYTSDYAFDVIEAVWPLQATADFAGSPEIFDAQVLDDELEEHLGKTAVELDFNLGAWRHITSIGPGTIEMVRGSEAEVAGMPLLIQFPRGEGRVTYTTFHNEAQTTEDMDRILSYLVFNL